MSAEGQFRCRVTELVFWVLSWKISGLLVSGRLWFIHGGHVKQCSRGGRTCVVPLSSPVTRVSPRGE